MLKPRSATPIGTQIGTLIATGRNAVFAPTAIWWHHPGRGCGQAAPGN